MGELRIGACSWNYDSWVGLVYTQSQKRSVNYLPEYSKKFRTVEIDSWFYKIPETTEVLEYKASVDSDFVFTCKAPQAISLTHSRPAGGVARGKVGEPNPSFLNPELFKEFLGRVEPLLPQLGAIMLEFEYLSKAKMASTQEFIDRLGGFLSSIPKGVPVAIEPRNTDFLNRDYFKVLSENNAAHVFSQKQNLPNVYDVYAAHKDWVTGRSVIRLMGDDRKAIEDLTKEKWNQIVIDRPEIMSIVDMAKALALTNSMTFLNVNNHFQGSAPKTIERLLADIF